MGNLENKYLLTVLKVASYFYLDTLIDQLNF